MPAKRKEERRIATRCNEEEDADVVGIDKGFDVGSTVCAQSWAQVVAVNIVAGNGRNVLSGQTTANACGESLDKKTRTLSSNPLVCFGTLR